MAKRIRFNDISRFDKNNRRRIAHGSDPIPVVRPFRAAYLMFRDYLDYDRPLTYNEWMNRPEADKAAALYVQFYDQIQLAWYKAKSFYAIEEDGVSTMMQYLIKNVPVIIKDEKRFTPRYIYRVAYNCLYCICHDIKVDKDRWELESRNITSNSDEEEVDVFNFIPSNFDIQRMMNEEKFWKAIMSQDEDTITYVDCVINHTRFPAGMKARSPEIIAKLKVVLSDLADEEF